MALDLTKFMGRFVEEAREHIKEITSGLLSLEKNQDDPETLKAVYRAMHTIKGGSRIIKLNAVTQVTHKLEDILDAVIKNRINPSKELSDLLFKGVDTITMLLDMVSSGDTAGEAPDDILKALEAAAKGDEIDESVQETAQKPVKEEILAADRSKETADVPASDAPLEPQEEPLFAKKQEVIPETLRVHADKLDELIKLMGEIVFKHKGMQQRMDVIREIERLANENLDLISCIDNPVQRAELDRDKIIRTAKSLSAGISRLIVDIREDMSSQEILINELQERSLKMRMLPLAGIFDTFHRTVRDMAHAYGKEIDFIVKGGETELDKKIIDKIGDALLHLIRNAIDHGIETPRQRHAAGKDRTGNVSLSARYDGSNVLIELSDDGSGISLRAIRKKALDMKLVDESELNGMADSEIINLIFHSGFTTSKIITDISGRGVGMDVVKRDIVETFKGSIRIETRSGKGSRFYIRLPLTTVIMPVLVITVSGVAFAVPSVYVKEIINISGAGLITVVDRLAVRLREQLVPIAFMADLLALKDRPPKEEQELLILIVSMGRETLGIVVDTLLDQDDRVIKPLPSHLQDNPWVLGVILSETEGIITVLNISRIMDSAKQVTDRDYKEAKPMEEKRIHILVVDDSVSTREIEKSILESHGYDVSLAGDGLEAFEKAGREQYDLFVVDIEMPRMNGFSLTKRLRRDEGYKDAPIILVTSRDKPEDIRRGMAVGANAYIIKGDFEESNLLETIKNLTG